MGGADLPLTGSSCWDEAAVLKGSSEMERIPPLALLVSRGSRGKGRVVGLKFSNVKKVGCTWITMSTGNSFVSGEGIALVSSPRKGLCWDNPAL